jgi:hypothetical protein
MPQRHDDKMTARAISFVVNQLYSSSAGSVQLRDLVSRPPSAVASFFNDGGNA